MNMVYTLILITSLKSQFHHDLDFKIVGEINDFPNVEKCERFGNTISNNLKSKNADLEVDVLCVKYY